MNRSRILGTLLRVLAAGLIVGLVVDCGSSSSSSSPSAPSANRPPTANVTVAPRGVALASATALTFTATGSDPEGDQVSFSWQFGDGKTASGQTVTHTFANPSTYSVVLSASDSHGGTTAVHTDVTVKAMTGTWVDADPRIQFLFTQNGASLAGERDANSGTPFLGYGAVSGNVANPRKIAFTITFRAQGITSGCRYEGTVDDQANNFHVERVNTGYWCGQEGYSPRRQ